MHGHCGRVLTSFFFIQPHSWQTLILISSLLGCASLVKVKKMPQIDPKSNPVQTFVILGLKMNMIVLKVLFKSFNKKMSNPSSSNLKWNLITQFPLLGTRYYIKQSISTLTLFVNSDPLPLPTINLTIKNGSRE